MTEPLQVGQFAIVDHEPVDRGPNAGVFHGRGPSDDRAELYIVAEGTAPAGESFVGQVVSAAGQAWHSLDMILTGALRRLFADAERAVRDWNRKSIPDHRVSIGMTCFGRRGAHAVIAQAGPGVAYHWHQDEIQQLFPEGEHGQPIGPDDVQPQLTRIDFEPGDRILILSTSIVRELDDELISGILGLEGEKILAELYHRIQHLRDASVLLIQNPLPTAPEEDDDRYVIGDPERAGEAAADDDEPAETEAPRALHENTFQPSLFIDDPDEDIVQRARRKLVAVDVRPREPVAAVPVAVAEIPAPLRRAAGDNRLALIAAQRRATATMNANGVNGLRLASAAPASFESAQNERGRRHRRDSFTRSLSRTEPAPKPEPVLEDVPLVDDMAEDLRAQNSVSSPIADTIAVNHEVSLTSGAPLVRVRPSMPGRWKGQGALSKRRPVAIGQQPPTWLVILIGLGVLLTLVGFLVVPGMIDDKNEGKYAALVSDAQWHIATAGASPDPAAQRAELQQAQALLLEARDISHEGPVVEQLLGEVRSALEVMDAVREPASVEVVASLEQFGDKPVAATRLVMGTEHAYILDSASSQVIDVHLASAERRVVFREDRDTGRGQPMAIAFGEVAGASQLLIVDGNRALWAINSAGEIQQLEFAPPKGLTPTDIGVYGRDLYVLDAAAAIIWRFTPTERGYGMAPDAALETPELAAARRMLVDEEIVTADADGTLHLFVNQLSLVLSEAGIDQRLVEPRQPNRFGKNGDIAIVDAPNDRIVVFRPDGAFDHQYRHRSFSSIAALAIQEDFGYVFAGGQLLRVEFATE